MLNKEEYINKATVKNMYEFENPFLINYFLTSLPRLFLETLLIFGLTIITLLLIGLNQSLDFSISNFNTACSSCCKINSFIQWDIKCT